jgi:hypothetical protein
MRSVSSVLCSGRRPCHPDRQRVLVPVLAVGMMFIPFWYVRLTATHYKKNIASELETALSIITTAYLRNEDILTAAEESVQYSFPVRSVFAEF